MVADGGEEYGVGTDDNRYLIDQDWTYNLLFPASIYDYDHGECLSWSGNATAARTFHFSNATALALSDATCTVGATVACSDGYWTPTGGVPLQCFIDCAGLLQCYYAEVYTEWGTRQEGLGAYEGCLQLYALGDPARDPEWRLDVKVVPV